MEQPYANMEEESRIFDIAIVKPPPPPFTSTGARIGKPRLMIHHLCLNNFKAFAGKSQIGPFNRGMSSIMGHLGTGKSNVIDAVIFVLGYADRVSDLNTLINSEDPNVEEATVEVNFMLFAPVSDGKYTEVPNSELCVSRTVYKARDRSPEYFLNGQGTQWENIVLKLREYDVDLIHNSFLISQGEVENVASMKPMATEENECGMLEYLDEVIGTARYKNPIHQIEERQQAFMMECESAKHNLTLLKESWERFAAYKDHAVHFLKCENRILVFQNRWYQRKIYNLRGEYEMFEEKKRQLEEIEIHLKNLWDEYIAITREIELNKKEAEAKRDDLKRMLDEKSRLEQLKKGLEEDETLLSIEQGNAIKNLQTKLDTLDKSTRTIAENAEKIEKLQEALPRMFADRDEAQRILNKKMKLCVNAAKKMNRKKEASQMSSEKKALEEKYEAQLKIEMLKLEFEGYKCKGQEVERLDEMKRALEACTQRKADSARQLDELNGVLPGKEAEYEVLDEKTKDLKSKLPIMEHKMKICKAEIEEIEIQREDNVRQDKFAQELKDFEKRGLLSGIYGRLGDLGVIDSKFDTAISAACGASLNSYVVRDLRTVTICTRLFKERKAEYAGTFIDLNKMTELYGREVCEMPRQHPENATCLYDMITVTEDRFKPVFYHFLSDVLIVNDKMQYENILMMEKGYRLVTYNGVLTEPNGCISAGGMQQYKRRMGASMAVGTRNAVNEPAEAKGLYHLKQILHILTTEVAQSRSELQTYTDVMDSLKEEIFVLKNDLRRFMTNVKLLKDLEEILTESVKKQEKICDSVKLDSVKVSDYKKKFKSLQRELHEADEALLGYNNETKMEATKRDFEFTDAVKEETEYFRNMNAVVAEATDKIARLKMEMGCSKLLQDRTEISMINSKGILSNLDKKRSELGGTMLKLENDLSDVYEKIQKSQKANEELDMIRNGIWKRISKLRNEITEMERKKRISPPLDVILKKLKEIAKLISEYEAKMEEDKNRWNRFIPEFEDLAVLEARFRVDNDEVEESENDQTKEIYFPIVSMEELLSKDCDYYEKKVAVESEVKKTFRFRENSLDEYARKITELKLNYRKYKNALTNLVMTKSSLDDVLKTRKEYFCAGLSAISEKMVEIYGKISVGGDVKLELVNSLDPYGGGLTLQVRTLRKTWDLASNLSGGDKTLSFMALVLASHFYRPNPFYLIDEMDGALDSGRANIVGKLLAELSENAQFIFITSNYEIMRCARIWIGVWKSRGRSYTRVINQKRRWFEYLEHGRDEYDGDGSDRNIDDGNWENPHVKKHRKSG